MYLSSTKNFSDPNIYDTSIVTDGNKPIDTQTKLDINIPISITCNISIKPFRDSQKQNRVDSFVRLKGN